MIIQCSKKNVCIVSLILTLCLLLIGVQPVLADTTGQELQITAQPDKLVLVLGPQWAGVEFELKLDSGTFPVPVVVSSDGILLMELGGSSTYTLTCLDTGMPAPLPTSAEQLEEMAEDITPDTPEPTPEAEPEAPEEKEGIPTFVIVVFFGGLFLFGGGLLALYFYRRSQQYYDDDGEDEE